jgi:hypothetical protein
MNEKDNQTLSELVSAWEASNGTLLELIDELQTDRGRELAAAYGLSDEAVAEFVELADRADEILARLTAPKPSSLPHDLWVKRTARELLALKKYGPGHAGGQGDAELGSPAAKPSNSTRFPKALREWRAMDGLEEDFDTLTPAQLMALGVPQAELAEELALEAWVEGGGTAEDFEDLTEEQRAEVIGLFT